MGSNQLQVMEQEQAKLRSESASLAAMLDSGEAEIDDLERGIVRQQACRMRLQAVESKIAAERARIAQEAAAADLAEAQRQWAAGDAAMLQIAGQLERMIADAKAAHALFNRAAGRDGRISIDPRAYKAVRSMAQLAKEAAPGVYDMRMDEAAGILELYRLA